MSRIWLIVSVVIGLVLAAAPASADVVLTLNDPGSLAGQFPTGTTFGTVTLHQCTGTTHCPVGTVQVTVALALVELSPPLHPPAITFANGGSSNCNCDNSGFTGYAVTWNVIGDPTVTISHVSQGFTAESGHSGRGYIATPYTSSSCGNQLGHPVWPHCFDYAIAANSNATSHELQGPLVFDVTKAGGLLISDFAAATGGVFFGVDVAINGCGTGEVGAGTGGGNTQNLPEPATLLLFGAGAAGAAALRRRRNRATAKASAERI